MPASSLKRWCSSAHHTFGRQLALQQSPPLRPVPRSVSQGAADPPSASLCHLLPALKHRLQSLLRRRRCSRCRRRRRLLWGSGTRCRCAGRPRGQAQHGSMLAAEANLYHLPLRFPWPGQPPRQDLVCTAGAAGIARGSATGNAQPSQKPVYALPLSPGCATLCPLSHSLAGLQARPWPHLLRPCPWPAACFR